MLAFIRSESSSIFITIPMTTNSPVPWNKGRAVGQKRPFSKDDIKAIARELESQKLFRDLCLFCVGIDTMLRGVDLVGLQVCDLINTNGHPKKELSWRQKKTNFPVISALTPYTQSAIVCHVASSKLEATDFLFWSMRGGRSGHITTSQLRVLIKSWARMVGLSDEDYSGHSLRRSKPALLYANGVRPEMLRLLLGHQNIHSTQSYLGINQQEALALARRFDCFNE